MRRGQRRADRFRRISISHAATKQRCCSVVGRLLDTFDKDERDVSVLQHFHKRASPAPSRNYGMFELTIAACGDRGTGLDAVVGANRV